MKHTIAIALLLTALSLASCIQSAPFFPGQRVRVSYASPESTLATLARAIENQGRANGLAAYLGGLADSTTDARMFHAFFDPAVISAPSGPVPSDWNSYFERTFYTHFAALRAHRYAMSWGPDAARPDDSGLIDAHLHRHYVVTAIPVPGAPDTIAIGFSDLTFIRSHSGNWVIAIWQDRVDPSVGARPVNPDLESFSARRLDSL